VLNIILFYFYFLKFIESHVAMMTPDLNFMEWSRPLPILLGLSPSSSSSLPNIMGSPELKTIPKYVITSGDQCVLAVNFQILVTVIIC
jgi:hypothetical protein